MDDIDSTKSELIQTPEQGIATDELVYIVNNSLGLRHVPTKVRSDQEMVQGIESGDALAIASLYRNVKSTQDHVSEIAEAFTHFAGSMKTEEIQALSNDFLARIEKFITASIAIDINQRFEDDQTVRTTIERLQQDKPSFLIGKFANAEMGEEREEYYGLGKCHSQDVSPKNIFGSFSLDKADLEHMSLDLDAPLAEQSFNAITQHCAEGLTNNFVEHIKQLTYAASNSE